MSSHSSHDRGHRALRAGRWSVLSLCLSALLAVPACDDSFEPIAPSDFVFSVFGSLDAGVDTQLIRVTPVRTLRTTTPDPLTAAVTLEHLGTGRIVQLEDSVFSFTSRSDWDRGPNGEWIEHSLYVHNFWTPEVIEPGAAYRFSVTREGREPAEAVVEIPHDYDVEVVIGQGYPRPPDWPRGVPWPGAPSDSVRIIGVKHLPFLIQETYAYDDCGSDQRRVRWEGRSAVDEMYSIAIQKQSATSRPGCGLLRIEDQHLRIVASEAPWPGGGYSPSALGDSSLTSNVSSAVGFLGGVFTKLIPYEDCTYQSGGAPIPPMCRLRYGPETATVSGTVSDTIYACVGPLDSVVVRLTELGPDPARARSAVSTRTGAFAIGALEPGIPHLVWARAPPVPIDSEFDARTFQWRYTEWFDVHAVHTDTLTFTPDQRMEYDIKLRRVLPCNVWTLLGTVTEARCGDGPIDSATVTLTEQGVQPPLVARTITARTDSNGKFFITGLQPQYTHLLRVRGPDPNLYTERVDYLHYLPDKVVKYDVQLGRLTSCSQPPPGGQ